MALIRVTDLKKSYVSGEVITPVLRGLNFSIERGEFVSIMGPSGSGKSTLMHILGFLDTPTSGSYFFNDQDTSSLGEQSLAELRNARVGFIFQAFNLLPRVTALENVMLPLVYGSLPKREHRSHAENALAAVGMSHRLGHTPNQLSGGEKQRVAIARALVNTPDVIFADEPTGNLDSKSGLQVMKILQGLNDAGHTIILVTHERYTADHARRVMLMSDGEITKDEPILNRQIAKEREELVK